MELIEQNLYNNWISQRKNIKKVIINIINILGKFIQKVSIKSFMIKIYLKNINKLKIIIWFLKNHISYKFKCLMDICATDYLGKKEKRFSLSYNLLSIKYNIRLHIKVSHKEFSNIPSLVSIYKGSNWYEREIWDLFGVYFVNHPDLRRILTDYGFEGYPLRKDFPQTGYIELRYDNENKHLIYEILELSQHFRIFNFFSPWNNVE